MKQPAKRRKIQKRQNKDIDPNSQYPITNFLH